MLSPIFFTIMKKGDRDVLSVLSANKPDTDFHGKIQPE
jgi:hypothetical protein